LKAITVILLLITLLPAKAQKLNETYLQAKADMIREQYAEAGRKILSIPAAERISPMYLTLGESYYLAGRYPDAARTFAVADSMKADPEAKLYAARAYAMMSQPAEATEWLQKYLGLHDKLSEGELGLDPAFAKIEHSREWKALWSKEWYNAAERKSAEAAVFIKRKKYTEALGIIDVEIANRTLPARFYALRAKVYEAMEQYDPAYESVQTAIRMRNNSAEYYTDAAGIAVRVKKYDAALDNINRAIRYDPYQLDLYLQRAAILRMNKRYDDARNDLNFYFKYLPADTRALYQMGMAETDAGNPLAGIEYFTMLIDKDRTKPDYFMARANAGIKANNYEMAGDDLSQALDLNPALPEAWCKKGIVLQQEGKLEDACYYWKTALGKGSTEAAEYIYKHCAR
jgi:tetratricopeptide (TPR) repeat protein